MPADALPWSEMRHCTGPVVVCQEPKSELPPRRPRQPATHRPPILGKRGSQERGRGSNMPPVHPRLGKDDPPADRIRFPAALLCDPTGQAEPPVHRSKKLVDIDELRLELHDEQRGVIGVPGQDVDDSALSEHAERHFWRKAPTRRLKLACHQHTHGGVPAVHEPIEVAATPPRHKVEPNLERFADSPQGPERGAFDVASFNFRVRWLGDAGPRRNVLLAFPTPKPDAAKYEAEGRLVHRPEHGPARLPGDHRRGTKGEQIERPTLWHVLGQCTASAQGAGGRSLLLGRQRVILEDHVPVRLEELEAMRLLDLERGLVRV